MKKATIEQKGNKRVATVELFLDEKWQGTIKDDHDVWFSLDESIELYWELVYGKRKKTLPKSTSNYLDVAQSDRTLYFKPPAFGHDLPQLMSNDGSPLLPMKFIKGKAQSELSSKAIDFVNNQIDKQISNIAMTKLEKGSLVTNTGRVQKILMPTFIITMRSIPMTALCLKTLKKGKTGEIPMRLQKE